MEKLLFATNNTHKLAEVRQILQERCALISLAEAGVQSNPVEDAPTLEGNALIKVRDAHRLSQLPTIADDTGLEVDCLGGSWWRIFALSLLLTKLVFVLWLPILMPPVPSIFLRDA